MSSSYYVTYGTDRLTFGGSGSVAWAASEPPLPSMAWIASGSSYCSGSASLAGGSFGGNVNVGGLAAFPFVCDYFSSESPISSVLTSTGLSSYSGTYYGSRITSQTTEETGYSFRVDVPSKNVYFKFINSSELRCSFSSRNNRHTVSFRGGVSIPTSEASAAEYMNAFPTYITTSNGKSTASLPAPTAAVTYDYTGSGLVSSEFTAASAMFSTAAYYGASNTSSPTFMILSGRTGCVGTINSYTAFLSWTASGEL